MKPIFLLTLIVIGVSLFAQPLPGRYFIAIDIPAASEPKIAEMGALLQKQLYGRFESADKYHITLHYFGVLTTLDLKRVQAGLIEISKRQRGFNVAISGLGFFPKKSSARVAWLGVKSEQIFSLHSLIQKYCHQPGTSSSGDKFHPHLTLARLSYPPPLWLVEKLQNQVEQHAKLTKFTVVDIVLMHSYQGKYSVCQKISLLSE